jgi:hypothetical protein
MPGAPPPPPGAPPPAPGWAVVSPPVAYPSPPAPPTGYASPYYSPIGAAPQPAVHRTPWVLIASAIVALVVLMAGCGTAIALLGRANVNVSGGINNQIPSPSPAVSPSPIASPVTLSGPTASNNGETIPVPTGWVVENKDNESITITDPSGGGSLSVGSGPSNPKQNIQENKATVDTYFKGKYPDTANCPGSSTTNGTLNGAPGVFWTLCFTIVSGGQSVAAAAPVFAGANSDGSVYYLVLLVTRKDNLQAFISEAAPVLNGIQWKLK